MATFLSLSGSAGLSYIKIPTITFDEIRMDYTPYDAFNGGLLYHIDTRNSTQTTNPVLYSDTVDNEVYTSFDLLLVNGNVVTSGTNSIPNGQRSLVVARDAAKTVALTLFARYTDIQNMKADVFTITFLKDQVIVADYDMSTGTLNDQSGNGKHATMAGGTWEEGTTPTGVDVSSVFSSQQKIYENIATNSNVRQQLFENETIPIPTYQSIVEDITSLFSVKQLLFENISQSFSTSQVISVDTTTILAMMQRMFNNVENEYELDQRIYKGISEVNKLSQVIFKDESILNNLKLIISADKQFESPVVFQLFDPDKSLVGEIFIDGEIVLITRISNSKQSIVTMSGQRQLSINMGGVLGE